MKNKRSVSICGDVIALMKANTSPQTITKAIVLILTGTIAKALMKEIMRMKNKTNRGAPKKKAEDKTNPEGLTAYQVKRLKEEAAIRNVSFAQMKRTAIDWFLTALDTKRGGVETSAIFDNIRKDGEAE